MLDLLKRAAGSFSPASDAEAASPAEEPRIGEHTTIVQYRAKTGEPLILADGGFTTAELTGLLDDLAVSSIEVIEPRSATHAEASPWIERQAEARQWLDAYSAASPIAQHAAQVLESAGAADLGHETVVCALLDGDVDASGHPRADAVIGGFAFRPDEASGEPVVRAVVGWGGRAVRATAERRAAGLVSVLGRRLLAATEQASAGPGSHLAASASAPARVCPHCGFELSADRAMFCPKCGMRMRGR